MNYLAHAFLSFGQPEWITGNLISDYIKGRKKYDYPLGVQQGINLHRAIDNFTDTHEATKMGKEIFRADYRLYSGAFVDVVYDHFLANDKVHFKSEEVLAEFALHTYQSLHQFFPILPTMLCDLFRRMEQQNWLYNYHLKWGIERSFAGVVYRSKYLEESATAFRLFEKNYETLKDCYNKFFPDLYYFAKQFTEDIQLNQAL